jgi:hypothetical protein
MAADRKAKDESAPTRSWDSNIAAPTTITELVNLAKLRWLIVRDYPELKSATLVERRVSCDTVGAGALANDCRTGGKVVCRSRLGGLLNFYDREAA